MDKVGYSDFISGVYILYGVLIVLNVSKFVVYRTLSPSSEVSGEKWGSVTCTKTGFSGRSNKPRRAKTTNNPTNKETYNSFTKLKI